MNQVRRMFLGLAVTAAAVLAFAPSASAAAYSCPGSFEVQHNDRIGGMQLPKGPYTITVIESSLMGCTEAAHLFSQFLEDWDGRLPRPWIADNARRVFRTGRNSQVGFRVTPNTTPSPTPTPPHPVSKRVCPGYFGVLHNDRIGSFNIPEGRYRITLLSYRGLSCKGAVKLFQGFLQDYNGVLPRPWILDSGTGTFSRGHRHVGFRVKPYVSTTSTAGVSAAQQEDSQGTHPTGGEKKCPGTFRVLNNDRIGALSLPKGNYNVWVKGIGCQRASKRFAEFLQDVSGVLPKPWILVADKATFKRGQRGATRIRVKPVSG